jgi:ABC-2 type transport system permease protein
MRDAALYLLRHSGANRARQLARKVKSPRYLIALLVGIVYLGLVFFGQRQQSAGPGVLPVIQVLGTTLTLLLVAKWWIFGTDRTALAFSPAEIQFFFPAPVSRPALLGFKLLRAQLPILINVAIWVVILHRGRNSPLPTVVYALSLWAVFMLIMLHRLGVALTRDSVTDHGVSGVRRHWVGLSIGALLAVMVIYAGVSLSQLRAAEPEVNLLRQTEEVLGAAPLRWLLLPFQLPFSMVNSADLQTWIGRFSLVLGLIGLHLLWVLRADRAFEEAAIAASVKRAELLDRWRRQGLGGAPVAGAHRRAIPLRPSASPMGAIVWKNSTRLLRTSSSFALVLMLSIVVAVTLFATLWGAEFPEAMDAISGLSLAWLLVLSLFGPQWIRNDLRSDLEHLDQLRTWPLSGGAIVTAEVLSSALALSLIQGLLAIVGLSALMQHDTTDVLLPPLALLAPFGLLFLATVNVLALGFQNAAAVLYPAWVKTEIRPGGIEAMGQHLLTAGASILLLALALVGPGGIAAVTGYLLWPHIAEWSLLPALALGAGAVALEAALLLEWVGTRLEQLDPSTER